MDTLTGFASGLTALAAGHTVGYISDNVTKKLQLHRSTITGTDVQEDSVFDDILDIAVEVAILLAGIKMVEKLIGGVTNDLGTMILFNTGVMFAHDGLPKKMNSLLNRITK
ncbi:MAG: hypothetical protein EHM41_00985 [Chloroflexi bacterium]|nr:MAG: hypothetical protein EHM41_00985 [Chloroflexota bacterium]